MSGSTGYTGHECIFPYAVAGASNVLMSSQRGEDSRIYICSPYAVAGANNVLKFHRAGTGYIFATYAVVGASNVLMSSQRGVNEAASALVGRSPTRRSSASVSEDPAFPSHPTVARCRTIRLVRLLRDEVQR